MNWFLAGWVLILQTAFWGLGLTLLILPRRWRPFWPGFCGPVGLALQSAVVWAGAHTTLPGTDSYALASLALPVALLGAAFWRLKVPLTIRLLNKVREWWLVGLIMTCSLVLQIAPFTKPPAALTVLSLGSCDAADYAAGARVLKEFSRRDRSGFLGETEVVRLLSVDNFFDFWLRLNHFTPSALLALDSSLLGRQPYELTSLLGIVLLLLNLPGVFFLARSAFRFGPVAAGTITLIYAFSPALLYAVYQVALGQLLAAPAVGLILWTCLRAYRAVPYSRPGRVWASSGVLLAGNWLLLGGYNFFILFAYVPLVAYIGGWTLWRWRDRHAWRVLGRLAALIAVNLLACALLFPERVISLAERFLLFDRTPFGWRIAPFRPDGWYGAFGSEFLAPAPTAFLALGGACCLALALAAWLLARRGQARIVGLAAASALPILCGYAILIWEEAAHVKVNASYDAYKLFTVFYPVVLASLCLWMHVRRGTPLLARIGAAALGLAVVGVNVQGAARYNAPLRRTMYFVDHNLVDLDRIERTPGVDAVNVCLPVYWDRLWANQFLLHKRQYFSQPTYEGRRPTVLRAPWTLGDRFVSVKIPGAEDRLLEDDRFYLVDRRGPAYLEVRLGSGWYEPENDRHDKWAWASAAAPAIIVNNPHPGEVDGRVSFSARSVTDRHLRLFVGSEAVWEGQTGSDPTEFTDVPIKLPPGETSLHFEAAGPPDRMPADPRALTFALYGLQIHPQVAGAEEKPLP